MHKTNQHNLAYHDFERVAVTQYTCMICKISIRYSSVLLCDELAHTSCWMFAFPAPCGREEKQGNKAE